MTKRWLVCFAGGLAVLSASAGSLGAGAAQQPPTRSSPVSPSSQRAALDRYCVGCHNAKVTTAGLALDAIDLQRPGDHAETLEKVVRKLRGRMMPPAGLPRPDEATYTALFSSL